ncbi:hypothetical protein GYMLUDRAFT_246659 [Collybiopsis luxurians FD-317 M1]|uniref:Uncharacterized protein n=1 Tax=Collybiopsis luxurians FD-317 M1 TaxID=944289 RepID=A0A0D0CQF5_9AGAR|nr:hypothetical protein GYMLUDRAFT_246659 [Collybiopsis luxurians FD-317 M1]
MALQAVSTSSATLIDIDSDTSSSGASSSSNHTTAIVSALLGTLLLLSLCIAALLYLKWRRLQRKPQPPHSKSTAASIASFVAGYSSEGGHADVKEYTYYLPSAPSLTNQSTRSPTPSLTVSTSFVSLPKSVYEPSPADTYSPAAPSSGLYTAHPGHSPLAHSAEREKTEEDEIDRPKPWLRLVPVRRAESDSEDV